VKDLFGGPGVICKDISARLSKTGTWRARRCHDRWLSLRNCSISDTVRDLSYDGRSQGLADSPPAAHHL